MNKLLGILLSGRTISHIMHWNTKSYAKHVALGELYDVLNEYADKLAEASFGKDGQDISPEGFSFKSDVNDPIVFIKELFDILSSDDIKSTFVNSGFLVNLLDELIASVSTIKYKLEQLQ